MATKGNPTGIILPPDFDVEAFQVYLNEKGANVEVNGIMDEATAIHFNPYNLSEFKPRQVEYQAKITSPQTPTVATPSSIQNRLTGITPKGGSFMERLGKGLVSEQELAAAESSLAGGAGAVGTVGAGAGVAADGFPDISGLVDERQGNELAMNKAAARAGKAQGIAGMATDGLGAILGLTQFIKGNKLQKSAKEPKYPEQLPNTRLSTRLAEADQQRQIGNPLIREQLMRDLASQRTLDDARAKVASGGQTGQYGALTQANSLRNIDAIRNIAYQGTQDRMRQDSVYDSLLGQKTADDRYRHGLKLDKYGQDFGQYQDKLAYGQQMRNSGVSNIFGSLKGAANNLGGMMSYGGINTALNGQYGSLKPETQQMLAKKYPRLFKYLGSPVDTTDIMMRSGGRR